MTKYKFHNYSKFVEKDKGGRNWFDWCLFLDETVETINQIDYVRYYLHPTFPNPERTVGTKENKFALFSGGWGTFTIKIKILKIDGSVDWCEYLLKLTNDNWPVTEIKNFPLDDKSLKVYQIVENSKFTWRKFDTIIKRAELPDRKVAQILKDLIELNLIRKAHFKSIDNQDLFGTTIRVGNEPKLINSGNKH
ncbi:pYEATS domain-containing protein [uncultured Draconibacterium sp.]|uniref:pYEATS domain-containing protein n=1 Tax=uncultured Draconibacterium sp. TaxID=1573823 RepID=UPI002AA847A0|nr:pYEATS domain-containing protein [uncultured Draconibacterium sp.]